MKTTKRVDEGFLDALLGDYGAAGVRAFRQKGISGEAQLVYDIFVKDFVADAVASLNAGIAGKFIDPSISSTPIDSKDTGTATDTSTSYTGSPKPKMGPTGAEKTVAAASQHRADIGSAANRMAAGKAAQAKPGFQRTASDLVAMKAAGLSEHLVRKLNRRRKLGESRYEKLNSIFESILEQTAIDKSIATYMTKWFTKYMKGVNWQEYRSEVSPVIQAIQDSYQAEGKIGKQTVDAITQLGQMAFSMAKTANVTPDGADDINIQRQRGETPVDSLISNINKMNPDDLKKLKTAIDTRLSGRPVSENKKK